jgi:hypothetical protein
VETVSIPITGFELKAGRINPFCFFYAFPIFRIFNEKRSNIMNIPDRLLTIISILESAVEYSEWAGVEDAMNELHFLRDEIEADFPLSGDWDDMDLE